MQIRHLRWDPENRLLAAWADGGANPPAASYAFAYDTSGERVLKYALSGGQVSRAELYIRDEGGNVLSDFLWVPETSGGVTGYWSRTADHVYLGRNELVKIERPEGTGEQWLTSLVHDHLGSTRVEVGSTASMNKIDYRPYGGIAWTAPTSPALTNNARYFTGHEREYIGSEPLADVLTGLDYMHARYYSLELGRFASVDPMNASLHSTGKWNGYSYCHSDPISLVDPDGRATDWAIGVNVFNGRDTVVEWQPAVTPEQRAVDMAIMLPFAAVNAFPLIGLAAPELALSSFYAWGIGLAIGTLGEMESDHPIDVKIRNAFITAYVSAPFGPIGRFATGQTVASSWAIKGGLGLASGMLETRLKGPIDGQGLSSIVGSGLTPIGGHYVAKVNPKYAATIEAAVLIVLEWQKNRQLNDASHVEEFGPGTQSDNGS